MSGDLLRLVPDPPIAPERIVIKPGKRRAAVIDFIASARRSLLMSIFRCDDLLVLQALGEAVTRGVQVEVLVTGRARGWGKRLKPLAGCLEFMGVSVRRFPKGVPKYHAKYMVADDCSALIGTMNLTRKSFRNTRDFLLVTSDPEVVSGLASLFRVDMAGAPAQQLNERLVVGPEGSRARIEELITAATRSIRIMDHKLSDPRILALLRDRQRSGVAVEIQQADPLGALAPHGRLIVIDGELALFGSLGLSAKSLDERRELAVIVREPELVAKLERQFSKRSSACAAAA